MFSLSPENAVATQNFKNMELTTQYQKISGDMVQNYKNITWRFPKMGATPSYHPFVRILHERNHPAMGVSPHRKPSWEGLVRKHPWLCRVCLWEKTSQFPLQKKNQPLTPEPKDSGTKKDVCLTWNTDGSEPVMNHYPMCMHVPLCWPPNNKNWKNKHVNMNKLSGNLT